MSETITSYGPADLYVDVSPAYSNIANIGSPYITPTQIATAYNVPSSSGSGVKVGIISLGGTWLLADLQKSMANLGLSVPSSITSVLVDGAVPSGNLQLTDSSSIENTLDLYCVYGMVPNANVVMYQANTAVANGWGRAIDRAVNENCDVISISWGTTESYPYLTNIESALANAVAKGTTVLAASGDYGSRGIDNSEKVLYPASSANIVAVGGTLLTLTYSNNSILTETADSGSGGGISTTFTVPSWQNGLTYQTYSNITHTSGAVTSLTYRGVPDISAPMRNYSMWYNGVGYGGFGGTSAATPIIAGIIARLKSLTGKSFGNPNPSLYGAANARAFNDFTIGNNASYLSTGYTVTQGWDPVVGLGSPNGQTLLNILGTTTKVKTASNTWTPASNVYVKTATNTWSNVKSIWTKTVNGWTQTF